MFKCSPIKVRSYFISYSIKQFHSLPTHHHSPSHLLTHTPPLTLTIIYTFTSTPHSPFHTHSPLVTLTLTLTLTPSLGSSGSLSFPCQGNHPAATSSRHQGLLHLHGNTFRTIHLQRRVAQRTHLPPGEGLAHGDLVTSSAKG